LGRWRDKEKKSKEKDLRLEEEREREQMTRFPVCYVSCGVHIEREVGRKALSFVMFSVLVHI